MSPGRKSPGSFWVGRNVMLLWGGQVLSQAGDSVYMIALMWLMLDLTGSKALTGLAAMSAYLPTLLIGLFAGVVADRYNRRTVMALADLLRAGLVMTIPLAASMGLLEGGRGAVVLGLVTFAVACVSTLFNPARDALIPDITPKGKLTIANGLIQTSWQLAMFVGPLMAGLVLPFVGLVYLFHFDAATFVLSLGFIMLLPAAAGRVSRAREAAAGSQILAGLRVVWSDRRLRGL
ncbi:MAG: MFS transporter, partial [Deltaproteobacteria bacterium]|nr:MFS transporter [Deltaproteobacteria bacterium]